MRYLLKPLVGLVISFCGVWGFGATLNFVDFFTSLPFLLGFPSMIVLAVTCVAIAVIGVGVTFSDVATEDEEKDAVS